MILTRPGVGVLLILLATALTGLATAGAAQAQSATQMVAEWPETARMAANAMMDKYGQPDEATPSQLVWHDNGPWKRTIVYREEIDHHFPMPHKDVLEQFIDYDVPPEMFDELAMYDGSVIVERTKGEISARCDKEVANFLALNLAHAIVHGEHTVEEARDVYARQIMAMKNDQAAPLTDGFNFELPGRDITNPDEPHPLFRGMQ